MVNLTIVSQFDLGRMYSSSFLKGAIGYIRYSASVFLGNYDFLPNPVSPRNESMFSMAINFYVCFYIHFCTVILLHLKVKTQQSVSSGRVHQGYLNEIELIRYSATMNPTR